jgi:hypothetical protein
MSPEPAPDTSWVKHEKKPDGVIERLMERWHSHHHLYEAYFWVIMTYPAWVWWKDSVFYLIIVSHYANYKTAVGAHEGRQARRNTESDE